MPRHRPCGVVICVLINGLALLIEGEKVSHLGVAVKVARVKNQVLVDVANNAAILAGIAFLPDGGRDEVLFAEDLVHQQAEMMDFVVIDTIQMMPSSRRSCRARKRRGYIIDNHAEW